MTHRPSIRVFDEWAIRQSASDRLALHAADRAFRALGHGDATLPPPLAWEFPRANGEVHIKGAHLAGSPLFTFKVATGFYGNVELGVPTGAGMVILFDADTGFPRGILADNGYLTDLRTAAAGALAAALLTHEKPLKVAMIGGGVQAHLQIRLLSNVRKIDGLSAWSRSRVRRERYQEKIEKEIGLEPETSSEIEEVVDGADLIITATPSRSPLVEAGWIKPGATVIAVGSDGPLKRELAPEILGEADKIVTDLTEQCLRVGELHHAVVAGVVGEGSVHAELGEIVMEEKPGREGDETIVCDLTGVGVQDAAISEMVFVELTGREGEAREH